jgi:cysteine desulfurase
MRAIYLDYNATTPIAPRVQQAMLPFLAEHFGNPSSGHALGRAAHAAVEDARSQVAALLGARADEIVFTSGGTESNNLAMLGLALPRLVAARGTSRSPGHLIVSAIEHPAVAEPAKLLESLGLAVSVVGVSREGMVDPAQVAAAMREETFLVSVMHANNEVGVLQPIAEIARIAHAHGAMVHTDAAQSVGKVATLVDKLGVDLLTIAGHKVYAPKGIGALYVRRTTKLAPALRGAGHERGLRPGTENVPYIVGLGEACDVARAGLGNAGGRMAMLRDRLLAALQRGIDTALTVNGASAPRLPNTLSVNFPGVAGADLLRAADKVCASTGSACHTGASQLSPTLAAMGVPPELGAGCVRLSLGWYTAEDDVDAAAELLLDAWERLRK